MGHSWIRQLRRFVALAWFTLLFALLGLVGVSHLAPHTGHALLVIRGGSMEPTIALGSVVAVTAVSPAEVAAGDVVTVRADNSVLITHRVSGVVEVGGERHLQLQGDANPHPDAALVPAGTVVGRVTYLAPLAGYALFMLSLPSGMLTALSLLATLLLAYWLLEDLELDAARAAMRRRRDVLGPPIAA